MTRQTSGSPVELARHVYSCDDYSKLVDVAVLPNKQDRRQRATPRIAKAPTESEEAH